MFSDIPNAFNNFVHFNFMASRFSYVFNKVITTMVIGLLDDCTFYARSAFTHLGLLRKMYDCSLHQFTTNQCVLDGTLLQFSSTSNRLAEI